jgi:hypothetical protein
MLPQLEFWHTSISKLQRIRPPDQEKSSSSISRSGMVRAIGGGLGKSSHDWRGAGDSDSNEGEQGSAALFPVRLDFGGLFLGDPLSGLSLFFADRMSRAVRTIGGSQSMQIQRPDFYCMPLVPVVQHSGSQDPECPGDHQQSAHSRNADPDGIFFSTG